MLKTQLEECVDDLDKGDDEEGKIRKDRMYIAEFEGFCEDLSGFLGAKTKPILDAHSALAELENEHSQKRIKAHKEADSLGGDTGDGKETLDEFGRKRVTTNKKIAKEWADDWSSDEEDEGEAADYASSRRRLMAGAKAIMEDVSDEFKLLSSLLAKFRDFKVKYPEKYKAAYLPLSVPE
eukprot:Platyproteum_vivax@DN10383_c0_g1_i1.p1